jgi:hypothetical protein
MRERKPRTKWRRDYVHGPSRRDLLLFPCLRAPHLDYLLEGLVFLEGLKEIVRMVPALLRFAHPSPPRDYPES